MALDYNITDIAIGVLTRLKLIFEACIGTFTIVFTNTFIRKIKKTIAPDRYLDDNLYFIFLFPS